jgi:hypothetical protein
VSDPLEPLARRVEGDPFFLASVLAEYARSEGLDDAGLAAALGCRPAALTDLRLCRAPGMEPREFKADVVRVAEHFGLEPVRLAEIARRGQTLQRARAAAAGATLLAARDALPPVAEKPEGSP